MQDSSCRMQDKESFAAKSWENDTEFRSRISEPWSFFFRRSWILHPVSWIVENSILDLGSAYRSWIFELAI
ncbi:MAG: hypothetical protein C4576_35240 [Desulfobacteraceae bacterium]|nr:MAG: hypothetical protein C4576_35240 [Desulfobacteraceae bacterium]